MSIRSARFGYTWIVTICDGRSGIGPVLSREEVVARTQRQAILAARRKFIARVKRRAAGDFCVTHALKCRPATVDSAGVAAQEVTS